MYRIWSFLTDNSLLLIAGAVIALVWANIDASSYHHFVEFVIWEVSEASACKSQQILAMKAQ